MGLIGLKCDNIGDLDNGTVRAMIDNALAKLIADIEDRAIDHPGSQGDGKSRKLTIEIGFHPDPARKTIYIDTQVKSSTPAYRSNMTQAEIDARKSGGVMHFGMMFRDDSSRVDQPTLNDYVDGEVPG